MNSEDAVEGGTNTTTCTERDPKLVWDDVIEKLKTQKYCIVASERADKFYQDGLS